MTMTESEIAAHVRTLRSKDPNAAYASLLALEAESRDNEGPAAWFDEFAALLSEKSGYCRVRGFRLIAASAPWIPAERMAEVLPRLLERFTDPKPAVVRQCLAALPALTEGRPEAVPAVRGALEAADYTRYAGSMAPLLEKDRAAALARLEG